MFSSDAPMVSAVVPAGDPTCTHPPTVPIAHREWLEAGAPFNQPATPQTTGSIASRDEAERLSASLTQYQQVAIDRGVPCARVPFARSPAEVTRAIVDEAHYQPPEDTAVVSEAEARAEVTVLEDEESKLMVAAQVLRHRLDQARRNLAHAQAPRLHLAASPAQRLYADALQVVLGFLPLPEVATTIRTCRTYYRISRRVNITSLENKAVVIKVGDGLARAASLFMSPMLSQVRQLELHDSHQLRPELLEKALCGAINLRVLTIAGLHSEESVVNEFAGSLSLPASLEKLTLSFITAQRGFGFMTKSTKDSAINFTNRVLESLATSHLPLLREIDLRWLGYPLLAEPSMAIVSRLNLKSLLAVVPTIQVLRLELPANQFSVEQLTALALVMRHVKELKCEKMQWSEEQFALLFPTESQSQLVKLTTSQPC